MYLVGSFGLFGVIASIFINETKGKLIYDYIEEKQHDIAIEKNISIN